MAVGDGLVGVAVRAGAEVGVGVNVEVGFGVKVMVGDGWMFGVSVNVGVLVGKTRDGLARTAPVNKNDMAMTAIASPVKMYLISEDMGASIGG